MAKRRPHQRVGCSGRHGELRSLDDGVEGVACAGERPGLTEADEQIGPDLVGPSERLGVLERRLEPADGFVRRQVGERGIACLGGPPQRFVSQTGHPCVVGETRCEVGRRRGAGREQRGERTGVQTTSRPRAQVCLERLGDQRVGEPQRMGRRRVVGEHTRHHGTVEERGQRRGVDLRHGRQHPLVELDAERRGRGERRRRAVAERRDAVPDEVPQAGRYHEVDGIRHPDRGVGDDESTRSIPVLEQVVGEQGVAGGLRAQRIGDGIDVALRCRRDADPHQLREVVAIETVQHDAVHVTAGPFGERFPHVVGDPVGRVPHDRHEQHGGRHRRGGPGGGAGARPSGSAHCRSSTTITVGPGRAARDTTSTTASNRRWRAVRSSPAAAGGAGMRAAWPGNRRTRSPPWRAAWACSSSSGS